MINRINLILRAKNITARQFAEEIGIQPSGMSHILGGRNNPSLDFVTKVIRRYPEIDANWLLLGRGEMYTGMPSRRPLPYSAGTDIRNDGDAADGASADAAAPLHEPSLFDIGDDSRQQTSHITEAVKDETIVQTINELSRPNEDNTPVYNPSYLDIPPEETEPTATPDGRKLQRILFIYSDKTFEEYRPQA